jgi:hypothetical protein
MSTHNKPPRTICLLLSLVVCAGLFQATAAAQNKPSVQSTSIVESAGKEGTDSPASPTSAPRESADIEMMKAQLALQQKRIEQLERTLDEQKRLMEQLLHSSSSRNFSAATVDNSTAVSLNPGAAPATPDEVIQPSASSSIRPTQEKDVEEASPLAIKLGKVYISPHGFLDFTTFVRDRNVGSGLGTNFGGIPFNNTVQGQLSETRFTEQNSRLGLRLDTRFRGAAILGYLEADFNGFAPTNVGVTTNSDGPRMRLLWLDVQKGKWELVGGQSWSLLTPNREGLSPLPANIFSTQNIDPNLQVGLTWARLPQFRVIYHASKTLTLALSLEATEQYGGGSAGTGAIVLPAQLAGAYAPQLNRGDSTFGAPDLFPDIVAKIAFDPKVGGRAFHVELAGFQSTFKFFNPLDGQTHNAVGGGALIGINLELFRHFRLIANGFYSDGGGRWIFGLGPDLIIKANGEPSLVHSGSTVSGIEYQVSTKDLFDAYYGGAYIKKNTAIDVNGQFVGYGFDGSPSNHNRSVQEITFGYTRTIWRDPNYGGLQFMTQYSYVGRRPWSVGLAEPGEAHVNMVYLNLRYLLPGAAPAFK